MKHQLNVCFLVIIFLWSRSSISIIGGASARSAPHITGSDTQQITAGLCWSSLQHREVGGGGERERETGREGEREKGGERERGRERERRGERERREREREDRERERERRAREGREKGRERESGERGRWEREGGREKGGRERERILSFSLSLFNILW